MSIQTAVQYVRLLGMQNFPAGKTEKGEPITVPQPLFLTEKISTNILLRNGERRLIFVGKPLQPEGQITFFIASGHVTPPMKSAPPAK